MKLNEFTKIADILAKEHKIRVKEGKGWASNIISREVFYKKNDIYNLSEDHILGFLLHEIAHIHYTTIIPEPTQNKELTKSTLNMIEDFSIEHIISQDYPNAEEILKDTRKEVLDVLIGMLPKMDIPIHEKALLFSAIRFENRGYATNLTKYEKTGEKISELMKKNSKLIYNRKETKELLPLTKKIINILIKELGKPTDNDLSKMKDEMHGSGIQSTQQTTTKKQIINALKSNNGSGWQIGLPINEKIQYIDKITDQATQIGKKLRSILKRNNAMEFGGRFRTGKLKAKKLAKTKITKDRKPFGRRIIKSNQSYAFAIASDVSGSMFQGYNVKFHSGDYALSSLHMIAEALKIAGIPRSLIIFGENPITISSMGKNKISWETLTNEQSIYAASDGGTNIDRAIKSATNELNKSRAERKIMIILTDGESDFQEMKNAHKQATNLGIECLGITISSDNSYMQDIFGKQNRNIDPDNATKIGETFIEILKTSITKSP